MNNFLSFQNIFNELNEMNDEELNQLIECFPNEAEDFIIHIRNSNEVYESKRNQQRNIKTKCYKLISDYNIELPSFYQSTTYRSTYCHNNNNNSNNNNYNDNENNSKIIKYEPVLRFSEMPVFTDSILYPDQSRRLQSTTHETFIEKPIHHNEPAKPTPTNLRIEGEREFTTTNKAAYTVKAITGRPARRPKIPSIPMTRISKPFYGETQFHADFPPERAWNNVGQMCSIIKQPCQPPKTQIQLYETNEHYFHTEQRDRFQGHDAKANPKPKSCKHETPAYTKPTVKLDCDSVTKLDYQPYTTEQILSVNPKFNYGRKTIKNGDEQHVKLKPEEVKLLKKYLNDLKLAKNQQLPKI
ncbi:unnamed protein product [Heterobilharzia americana]|nr:unnamed protein product [Heterobilharzia americana]